MDGKLKLGKKCLVVNGGTNRLDPIVEQIELLHIGLGVVQQVIGQVFVIEG